MSNNPDNSVFSPKSRSIPVHEQDRAEINQKMTTLYLNPEWFKDVSITTTYYLLRKELFDEQVSDFRDTNQSAANPYINYADIPEFIADFLKVLDLLSSKLDLTDRLILFRFVSFIWIVSYIIHAAKDGNGRTFKMIVWSLLKQNLQNFNSYFPFDKNILLPGRDEYLDSLLQDGFSTKLLANHEFKESESLSVFDQKAITLSSYIEKFLQDQNLMSLINIIESDQPAIDMEYPWNLLHSQIAMMAANFEQYFAHPAAKISNLQGS